MRFLKFQLLLLLQMFVRFFWNEISQVFLEPMKHWNNSMTDTKNVGPDCTNKLKSSYSPKKTRGLMERSKKLAFLMTLDYGPSHPNLAKKFVFGCRTKMSLDRGSRNVRFGQGFRDKVPTFRARIWQKLEKKTLQKGSF